MKIEEKDNVYKISMPLITDEEIRNIDNNFESIVKEFTKSYVKEKDLVIAQYIMQKQQDKIVKLESDNYELNNRINDYIEERRELIEKLEEDCKRLGNYEKRRQMDSKQLFENDGMWNYCKEILSILKG